MPRTRIIREPPSLNRAQMMTPPDHEKCETRPRDGTTSCYAVFDEPVEAVEALQRHPRPSLAVAVASQAFLLILRRVSARPTHEGT